MARVVSDIQAFMNLKLTAVSGKASIPFIYSIGHKLSVLLMEGM
jgi:hypothetical protein